MDAHQYQIRLPSGRKLNIAVDKRLTQRDLAWLLALIAHNETMLDIGFSWTSEEQSDKET